MKRVFVFVLFLLACRALGCETALTHEELCAADRSRAVEFEGISAGAFFGEEVSAAGDVNGDGFADFAVTAPLEDSSLGVVYVVFGRSTADWRNATFDFAGAAIVSSWVKILGTNGNYLGSYGITHGDFNGDGLSDLLISAKAKAVCVFGHMGVWDSFSVSNSAIPGFAITGGGIINSIDYVGNAGDMNGDGIDDLVVAPFNGTTPNTAYIIFGTPGNRSDFALESVNGANGFMLSDGSTSIGHNTAMGSAGDVDGDGLADLALGSHTANNGHGRAYVLFAHSAAGKNWPQVLNLTAELDGTNGFIIDGLAAKMWFGSTVVGAGDVNADGFADVYIGSYNENGAYLVFGHSTPFEPVFGVSELDGTNGFHFKSAYGEFLGYSGGSAGDMNGDGIDDAIIGGYFAQNSNGSKTGAAVLLYGHKGSWLAELNFADVVGSVGFIVEGPSAMSEFGFSAHSAGDVNGDGSADLIVGARKYNASSGQVLKAGYAALVFGVADDHCAVCSNTSDSCLVCEDGFILNGTICEISPSLASSSAQSTAIVVIETGGGTVGEVAEEIAQLLGVDVGQISIIEITPGTFEITVINEEVAQQLVTLITECMETAET